MTKRSSIKGRLGFFVVLAVLLLGALAAFMWSESPTKFSNQVVQLEEGFGYEILLDGKVIIHQEYIPGVKGFKRFYTKDNAQKVADLVVERFKTKESPALNRADLEKIGIDL